MKLLFSLLILFLLLSALDHRLAVRTYTVHAEALRRPMRIALLSDHHSSRYGRDQKKLLSAISARSPDLILLAGDMFDCKRPPDETVRLLAGLERYPVYSVLGNHECRRPDMERCIALAREHGVTVLTDELVSAAPGGIPLWIGGIDDPEKPVRRDPAFRHGAAMDAAFGAVGQIPGYRILVAHRPELFPTYADYGFDLVVAGHTHGGQVRIPGLIRGVYAPGQGILPKWTGGVYRRGETTLVVSRGLAKTLFLPRIWNRPELVIIDLSPDRAGSDRM